MERAGRRGLAAPRGSGRIDGGCLGPGFGELLVQGDGVEDHRAIGIGGHDRDVVLVLDHLAVDFLELEQRGGDQVDEDRGQGVAVVDQLQDGVAELGHFHLRVEATAAHFLDMAVEVLQVFEVLVELAVHRLQHIVDVEGIVFRLAQLLAGLFQFAHRVVGFLAGLVGVLQGFPKPRNGPLLTA